MASAVGTGAVIRLKEEIQPNDLIIVTIYNDADAMQIAEQLRKLSPIGAPVVIVGPDVEICVARGGTVPPG